ncbi:VOC family protein [Terracoccus luteus]|uniref:Putative glyoxalase superfamily protein PhnB n=1 Tax=Terracoccus luteus TaxID=53356 RepID=A0A839PSX5_9MICO|nr:VOC family protein [Terracoccus luteus]MBB2985086.1 putative glyoxalase superfamily protein PhnB [Terracoccus luteus]MCP2170738.1 putative glyoxalase superfamily protein PhnB [Terracoccus luteus]
MDETITPGPSTTDHNVWVGLSYEDPLAARDWLRALGFRDGILVEGEHGEVVHSEMVWPEGGRVMVSSRARADGTFVSAPGAATVYVVTDDVEAVHERAQRLGARVVRPLATSDYGSSEFSVVDPEGNSFSFGTYAG